MKKWVEVVVETEGISGEIVFRNKMHVGDHLAHFAAKQTRNWIEKHRDDKGADDVFYNVTFQKIEGQALTGCEVDVRVGPQIWGNHAMCKTPEQALLSCLARMSPMLNILSGKHIESHVHRRVH